MCTFPAEVERGDTLLSCCSSPTVNKNLFAVFFVPDFSYLGNFLLVISQFLMGPKHTVEVLSSVPQCRKAVVCLMEKIHVLI